MTSSNKHFIIFRTDKLGDFIIHSRPILELKKKFPHSIITVVCSDLNKKIISKFSFIDHIIVFNKSDPLISKFKIFIKIIFQNYYASFILDGKNFSYLCNIFLKSSNKIGLVHRSQKKIFFKLTLTKPNSIYNYFFFNKHESFTNRNSLQHVEHFPQKYINLFSEFISSDISVNSHYAFELQENSNLLYFKICEALKNDNFIILHFDEKWLDIISSNDKLINEIINLQITNNLKIIITAYNNTFEYFNVLKKKFSYYDCVNLKDASELTSYQNSKILILDNLEIFLFERFLKNSKANISCHSGFIAQVCGSNNGKIIDIINEADEIWYSCWKPKNTFHKFVYKSSPNKKNSLNKIFSNLSNILKEL